MSKLFLIVIGLAIVAMAVLTPGNQPFIAGIGGVLVGLGLVMKGAPND